jgi:voltage-gated potassium channel
VTSLWDSFWWAMVSVTTVGYGDIYPMTTAGRLIAIGLMVVGIGTLGTFTASIAHWVLREREEPGEE